MSWGQLIERDPQAKRPRVCERLGTDVLLQVNSDIPYHAHAQIKDSLSDEQRNLDEVRGRIAEAGAGLDELRALQRDLFIIQNSIETHRRLLRPSLVRSLPAEVLSMIFLWYIHISHLQAKAVLDAAVRSGRATPETMDKFIAAHNTAPLILMYVCRRWCQTVLGDPSLWTMVAFSGRKRPELPNRKITMLSTTFTPPEAYQKQLGILQLQMGRAKSRPLSLFLHLSSRHHMHRHIIPTMIHMALDAFPRAAEFHLHFDYINAPLRDYLLDSLEDAECLHTLTIVYAKEFAYRTPTLEMRVHRLTRVILSHTPNLQRLVLDIPADAIERSLKGAAVMDGLVD